MVLGFGVYIGLRERGTLAKLVSASSFLETIVTKNYL